MGIHSLYTASTGMDAQLKHIDMIANNVANLETQGFKRDRMNFADLFYRHQAIAGGTTTGAAVSPSGINIGHGVRVVSTEKIFEPGGIVPTDNKHHMAITGGESGNLFFRIQRPNGEIAYTRAGNFTLNDQGFLVTPAGDFLDPQIQIDPAIPEVNIRADGLVTATDGVTPDEQQLGQILLTRFINPAGLRPDGDNLFYETAASGAPQDVVPGSPGGGRILQGHIEGSNVSAITELVNLIKGQRAYEINSNVIQTADEALQIANNLRA